MTHDFTSLDGRAILTIEIDPLWIGGEIYQGCHRCDGCGLVFSLKQLRAKDDGSLNCKDCGNFTDESARRSVSRQRVPLRAAVRYQRPTGAAG